MDVIIEIAVMDHDQEGHRIVIKLSDQRLKFVKAKVDSDRERNARSFSVWYKLLSMADFVGEVKEGLMIPRKSRWGRTGEANAFPYRISSRPIRLNRPAFPHSFLDFTRLGPPF